MSCLFISVYTCIMLINCISFVLHLHVYLFPCWSFSVGAERLQTAVLSILLLHRSVPYCMNTTVRGFEAFRCRPIQSLAVPLCPLHYVQVMAALSFNKVTDFPQLRLLTSSGPKKNEPKQMCLSQINHQLDATLCRFYFCRVTLHVSGVKRPSSGVFKTGTAATGTCVIVAGKSSHHLIRP